jgi:hypothetical protein
MKINKHYIKGLESEKEASFSIWGCGNCGNGLAGDVYQTKAYFEEDENWDYYPIALCLQCICAYHNGDELDQDCENIYNI